MSLEVNLGVNLGVNLDFNLDFNLDYFVWRHDGREDILAYSSFAPLSSKTEAGRRKTLDDWNASSRRSKLPETYFPIYGDSWTPPIVSDPSPGYDPA
jgi:hypothetical protein